MINASVSFVVTSLHNGTSSKIWRDVICYSVATSVHTVHVSFFFNFIELITKYFVVFYVGL